MAQPTQTTQLYAFTYKKNCKKVERPSTIDYVILLRDLEEKKGVKIHSVYYELDASEKWHVHGMFYGPKDLQYKKMAVKNFTSKIKKVYDYAGWECYCRKQQDDDSIDPPETLILKRSLFKNI